MIKRKQKWNHKKRFKIRHLKGSLIEMNFITIKLIFPFLILFFYFYINRYKKIKINQINETKICICTMAKQENLYIREYI